MLFNLAENLEIKHRNKVRSHQDQTASQMFFYYKKSINDVWQPIDEMLNYLLQQTLLLRPCK